MAWELMRRLLCHAPSVLALLSLQPTHCGWADARQVMVVPISEGAYDYARDVRKTIRKIGVHTDADCSDRKMQKKVGQRPSGPAL